MIGTVKLLTLEADLGGIDEACDPVRVISGGIASAAGIGSPRAAATSCASVHDSL